LHISADKAANGIQPAAKHFFFSPAHTLTVTWSDGVTANVDLSPVIAQGDVFASLQDAVYFVEKTRVVTDRLGLEWAEPRRISPQTRCVFGRSPRKVKRSSATWICNRTLLCLALPFFETVTSGAFHLERGPPSG
jgi:hypothetical protein